MEKITKIIITVMAIGLLSGFLLDPSLTVVSGLSLWFLILLLMGGAEDGNPYRTMNRTAMPDFLEVGRFMKPQKVQKEGNVRGRYIWMLLASGAFLLAVGIYFMHKNGMW